MALDAVEPGTSRLFARMTAPEGESSSITVPAGRPDPDGPGPSFGPPRPLIAALWPLLIWSSSWLIRELWRAAYVAVSAIRRPRTTSEMTPIRSRPRSDCVMDYPRGARRTYPTPRTV